MKHFLLTLIFLCAFIINGLKAQALPELDFPILSDNYIEVCKQLDDYFQYDYDPALEASDCPDDKRIKYLRWKWFWRDRVQPDGAWPDVYAQWLEGQKYFGSGTANRGGGPLWQNEGPDEIANGGGYWGMGRTKHIAFHPSNPDIFYVGTPAGGIWKTSDGGNSWEALGDGLPNLPVSTVLVDHLNPETLYIALGDKGGWWMRNAGVYKSIDGGQTWAPTSLKWTLADNRVIYNMIMHPVDPKIIYIAANYGILRTMDGGDTWVLLQAGEYTDLKFKPNDPATLYGAKHDYWGKSQVIKTTDAGANWLTITQLDSTQNDIRIIVSLADADYVGLRMSKGRRFLLSKNAGATFTDRSKMPESDHLCFSPTDTNVIYTSGVVVHKSTDQGLTWKAITHWYNNGILDEVHADVHDIVPNPYNLDEIFFCNDGGVYRYYESLEAWFDHSNGLGIAQFYRLAVSEKGGLRVAAGSQDNGGWQRRPDGSWRHTNGGDAMCQIIDPTDDKTMYSEYWGGNDIYRSTDGYQTDINIANNLPGNPVGDWVTPFILNPRNPKTFIVGFEDVFLSHTQGDQFIQISKNLTGNVDNDLRDIVMARSDTNTIYACWSNKFYRTKNYGQLWESFTVPGSEAITRLAVDPNNAQRVWATKGGYAATQKVFRSLNGGQTWSSIPLGLPNVPVHCILFDPQTNYLFVGTEIGIFHTNADDIRWTPFGQGMPAVIVLDLDLRETTRRLYAATHGRGIYSVDLQGFVGNESPTLVAQKPLVFPNPGHNMLFIQHENKQPFNGKIELFDVAGRQVLQKMIRDQDLNQVVLPVSNLSRGVFLLRLTAENGTILAAEKVILD